MRRQSNRPFCGFTLIELLVVMVIISILLALILAAAQAGAREAEIRATQALIIKLENALTDRIDAFSQLRIEPNAFHTKMANIYNSTGNPIVPQSQVMQRAQVLANYEYLRSEFPDVFFVQDPGTYSYPVNFGMNMKDYKAAWDKK